MFFPSATMCNQIAMKVLSKAGEEVIGAEDSHIFNSEAGALSFHSRVQPRAIKGLKGIFNADDMRSTILFGSGVHTPKTSLMVVENTTNAGGGYAWPLPELDSVLNLAKSLGLKSHLDGSRLFNAAAATKVDISRLAAGFDTVTICFSKGLSCGLGAILAFDTPPREEVRRLKQIFGGAMRQSGMLAAGCLYALEHHVDALALDHQRAKDLARGLSHIAGIVMENIDPPSNILFFSLESKKLDAEPFIDACAKRGLRFSRFKANRFRAVTHRDISDEDIKKALSIVAEVLL